MIKVRVIPILTFNGIALVKSTNFTNPRMLGNPIQVARVFNSRDVDELVFLDIMATKQKRKINLTITKKIIDECFMPVAIGGGISTLNDINNLLKIGADKVIIKTVAIQNPTFISEASSVFGSQCISVAVDVINLEGEYFIHNDLGLKLKAADFIENIQTLGAGEIILTSVDCDGKMQGFDFELYLKFTSLLKIPTVLVGGAGNLSHFTELFSKTNCMAVGAASIFSFTQHTSLDVKNAIFSVGRKVRNI